MIISESSLDGKRVAITGVAGSWGQQFTESLLRRWKPVEIRAISRGELAQVAMSERFLEHPLVRFRICDERDRESIVRALQGIDVVIHLGALKHVGVIEQQQREALLTNVEGTSKVIEAALENLSLIHI